MRTTAVHGRTSRSTRHSTLPPAERRPPPNWLVTWFAVSLGLQRKYGRWGLAYLESLLRAADWAASAEPSAFVTETKEVSR